MAGRGFLRVELSAALFYLRGIVLFVVRAGADVPLAGGTSGRVCHRLVHPVRLITHAGSCARTHVVLHGRVGSVGRISVDASLSTALTLT